MILSNTAIVQALNEGRIILDPAPPLDPKSSPPYNTTALDLRLGDEISVLLEKKRPYKVDLAEGSFSDLYSDSNFEKRRLDASQPYTLRPGTLVLAQTLERVHLPLNHGTPVLAARVEGRSGWARCGLLVHFTAPTIHAGFNGSITLEICNLGTFGINLYPHQYICQLIFEEVEGLPILSPSKFRGQRDPGGVRKRGKRRKER